ncbi:hypothetical protein E2C01_008215 [Portunus trituberculatus]|uniref:Uncharacterized protein n=1 Tax=Portunus trituberculatus TaxID=210409 RepID=A0A5B7D591_PORTR|nr:hypothetical protein [Portunus trituberculatus]
MWSERCGKRHYAENYKVKTLRKSCWNGLELKLKHIEALDAGGDDDDVGHGCGCSCGCGGSSHMTPSPVP